jgi:hypothetical protein
MFSRGKKNSLVSLLIFNLKENLRFIIHERFSFSKYDKINIVQHEGLINWNMLRWRKCSHAKLLSLLNPWPRQLGKS